MTGTTKPRCPHGMPSPASCLECMEEGNLGPTARPAPPKVGPVFVAQHDGHCGACNLPLAAGQQARAVEGPRSTYYVHDGCE